MRIGISTSVIEGGHTGIAQYVLSLCQALLPFRDQHQFTLFALENDVPLFNFAAGAMNIVHVEEQYRPAVRNILWHQTVLPQLAAREHLNLLHIPSYRRLLAPRPCALVATIHDLAPFRVAKKYDWKRMFYGRVIARRLAHRCHQIITPSRQTSDDVQQFFKIPANKITVIHNGLDHEHFNPGDKPRAKSLVKNRFGLAKPFFLYLARLEHPGKNHIRLLRAYEQFRHTTSADWQLVFAGKDCAGAAEIHDAIAQSPYAPDVRTLGFVSREDLPELYRAAQAFVYPSLYEGFGLPPVEAMACGTPVLCSCAGALAEIVGNAAITLHPEDTAAFGQQMHRLATDQTLRADLSQRGLTHAAQFNWRRTAQETLNIYAKAFCLTRSTAPSVEPWSSKAYPA